MRKTCRHRKITFRVTCITTFITTLLILAFSAQNIWAGVMVDPPFLLGDGLYPDVARGLGDQVHVAWMNGSNVYYRLHNGTSWQATESVPMSGYGIVQKCAPDIWADSNNVPHIVWGDDGEHLLYVNKEGGSWGTPEVIVMNPDTSAWYFRDVRVAVASDGKRHVIYRRKNLLNSRGEIFHMLWNNSWGTPVKISEGTATAKRCHLTLSSDDALHTVWRQKTGPSSSYEPTYRKWVGGSFQPVIQATYTVPSAGEDPHVAVDTWNNPHISFPEGTDVGYIEWLGGEFSDVEIIATGMDPVVAIDDAGAKYVFWEDEYSVNIGSSWDTPLTYVAGSVQPDIIGGSDKAHVVYKNGTMSYYVALTAGGGPPPADTTITVSTPNGGELWQAGSTNNIIWNTTGSVDEVDIAYSTDGGGSWIDIITGYQNLGYYPWLVPNTPSNLCRVRVQDAADGDPSDTSDANFGITNEPQGEETVTVTSPNGGEWWQVGSEQSITWDSSWNFTYVQIHYSTDAGQTWIQVTSRTSNDGERAWTIPNTPSDSCLVRVWDWTDQVPEDVSNAVFTIGSGTPPVKQLTVITPNGGEILEVASDYSITWDHTGSVGDVAIHYSTNNGTSWNTVTNRTANDHQRNWTVPAVNSDSCLIRIWEADTGEGMDLSDSLFSIVDELPGASLTLTSPNGGEVLLGGAETSITWQSIGAIDSVQLQYTDDDGGTWYVVVASYPNEGTYTWSVPTIRSLTAKVKVVDLIGGEASDESDSTFYITDDITAPALDTLYLTSQTELVVFFTEEVDDSTAELVENYSIDNDITVLSAILDPGLTSVLLSTTQHSSGVMYTITIDGVTDTAEPPNQVAPGTSGEYEYNPSDIGDGGNKTASIPKSFALSQNFPNPFNPSTRITFAIPEEEGGSKIEGIVTRLNIYNLKGQLIKSLFEGYLESGYHTITWDGRDEHGMGAGSGVYLYRLEAGNFVVTKKMILVK